MDFESSIYANFINVKIKIRAPVLFEKNRFSQICLICLVHKRHLSFYYTILKRANKTKYIAKIMERQDTYFYVISVVFLKNLTRFRCVLTHKLSHISIAVDHSLSHRSIVYKHALPSNL